MEYFEHVKKLEALSPADDHPPNLVESLVTSYAIQDVVGRRLLA